MACAYLLRVLPWLAVLGSDLRCQESSGGGKGHWVGKPRNEYAGRGISIFAGGSQLFKDAAATKHIGVVQR